MGQAQEQEFKQLLKEQYIYRETLALISWDMHTCLPKKGLEQRLETVGFLSEKLHELQTSSRMKELIELFKEDAADRVLQKSALECEKIYNKQCVIPAKEYKEYVMLRSKSEALWQEAREKSDFSLFQPYLEKIVEYNKRFANYWGYENHIYDALLGQYEPGITVKTLDEVFPKLRKELTTLLKKIQESKVEADSSPLYHYFSEQNQEALSLELINRIGYDLEAGRMDTSVHPYTFGISQSDVRITTRYNENDFQIAVFSALHEAGHGLYEQNFSESLKNTPLAEASSMGMHEAQALFWEGFIGRSKAFWETNADLLEKYAPAGIHTLSLEQIYHSLHAVKPSFIRVEADEVTYPLHIMIRYELEKGLLTGEIKAADLPQIWNEKMEEYLGIRPETDREGVLQDIHWASGDFGYFPSYTLGYIYASQLHSALSKTVDIEETVRQGQFSPIKQWFTKNVYQYGKMKKPLEIIEDLSGEQLNPDHFVHYLNKKYKKIYQF